MIICFFDMEGTLLEKNISLDNGKVAPSAWTALAKEISEECFIEEEITKDLWLENKYLSYTAWMKDTVRLHLKHGMNKKHLDKILNGAKIHDGARELFHFLREKNVVTALISGGFKQLADITQRKLKIDHAYSACEYFFDENDKVEHFNLLPTDELGKLVFMKHLADEYAVELKDCIFIGDGKNDVHLAKEVGTSIAFNAQQELIDASTFSINQDKPDLSVIIPILRNTL
ncbi:HAD family hydrolase [Rahnella inusitata]|uniref:phosphoserine phosphatase n=1 Tax=Rahnella inusitata TaxID=58169 RepID=A0ABX9P4V9_9GAMM|nr:HAD-IB family phosphatase [Rahnella inusitata]RJT16058.1 HAD family hydrolase [Rahnella inusitata]